MRSKLATNRRTALSRIDIPEFAFIEQIENIALSYCKVAGIPAFDVSHWDAAPKFERILDERLEIPIAGSPCAYQLAYDLSPLARERAFGKLGLDTSKTAVFTDAGTTAILAAINLLRVAGIQELIVLAPYYFSVKHVCQCFGINCIEIPMERNPSGYRIPRLPVGQTSAVWITNPAYCTSTYYKSDDIKYLLDIADRGIYIIADECLCRNGFELARSMGSCPTFIGVYTPHKAVVVNGMKFGAVAVDRCLSRALESWTDVLTGALSNSAVQAIHHFHTSNFDVVSSAVFDFYGDEFTQLKALLGTSRDVELDTHAQGHFVTIYLPGVPSKLETNMQFLRTVIFRSGTTFIPSTRNHFSGKDGFGFRVNLARSGPGFLHRIDSLISAICDESASHELPS